MDQPEKPKMERQGVKLEDVYLLDALGEDGYVKWKKAERKRLEKERMSAKPVTGTDGTSG
jgi:hypothetical protein